MASSTALLAIFVLSLLMLACSANGQLLQATFYDRSCPNLQRIVQSAMVQAVRKEPRMGASILRLFFHDCFNSGCDASILLDDTPALKGEKNAGSNFNSARGFQVIDAIKSQVEAACRATVSCADILALAARDGVVALGGPTWTVQLGRHDSMTAFQSGTLSQIPSPFASLPNLLQMFQAKGLDARDLTALSGAHSIGQARCSLFRNRIYNDPRINPSFARLRKLTCPATGGDGNLAPLDSTPNHFGNEFYKELMSNQGLLQTDQVLFGNGVTDAFVRRYAANPAVFARDFAAGMVKLGAIGPLTGNRGQIRLKCGKVN